MSMMKIFDISGSAVSAQSQRLNVVASNLANVDTVAGPDGKAYKGREVTFQTVLMNTPDGVPGAGVKVSKVSEDQSPGRRVHDPASPSADADGYVTYSNVNAVDEMVGMVSTQRAYEAVSKVISASDEMLGQANQLRRG